ncbi:MAG: FAD-binding oxidoreductase [Bacteroidia bacterium]|nr:FAD-binding oxidoreductase [Bacteroidia bacterium]
MVVQELLNILGPGKVLTGASVSERYFHIWATQSGLQAAAVILPRSTSEVSHVLSICNKYVQPVIVHGGLTGLVGSTESEKEQIVISLEKMNSIEEIDTQSRTMTVQAGVILENIQEAAKSNGMLFPLNFGAKGSAHIGGAISTNAGGLRVFRYGQTRNLILGLEAVLADGTIISSMKKIIKDNSGYDVKQLFIGSEGTLGIVTKAVLRLQEAPQSRNSVIAALPNYKNVVAFLKFMDAGLAGTLSAFELLWPSYYESMTSDPAPFKPPIPHGYPYYVLLDSLASNRGKDKLRIEALLEHALENNLIIDAALAENESDQQWFWSIREQIEHLQPLLKNFQGFDISVPIPAIGTYINSLIETCDAIPEIEKIISFGHVADGNIHLIFGKSVQSPELVHRINKLVYLPLKELGGSISAEHGIGIDKKDYLYLSRSQNEIDLMKRLKKALDPNNILNPSRIFDM